MTRWKPLPWLVGVALLAVSLVAANRLIYSDAPPAGGGGGAPNANPPAARPAPPPAAGGITVLGTVDAAGGVARIDAPAVPAMPALTVLRVLVKNGDTVKPGDVLVQFDDTAFVPRKAEAEAELAAAVEDLRQARAQEADHAQKVKLQELAVETATTQQGLAQKGRDTASEVLERSFTVPDLTTGALLTEPQRQQRRRESMDLQKAEAAVSLAALALKKESIDLERIKAAPADSDVKRAQAKIDRLKATVAEAEAAIELCKLKARVGGTVEQVAAVDGMTYGQTARTPLMYLVPTGKRVVRAEVEAEFAAKVEGTVGKKVTICDAHNFAITYEGVVARSSTAFLGKRNATDTLAPNPTRVQEFTIDVLDPAPPGQPPLRPGLPVRVVFGP